jgi:hypothetical protein
VQVKTFSNMQAITPDQRRLLNWQQETQALARRIMERRQGQYFDVNALQEQDRDDLEQRHDWIRSLD